MKLLSAFVSFIGMIVGVILFAPFIIFAIMVGLVSWAAGRMRNLYIHCLRCGEDLITTQ